MNSRGSLLCCQRGGQQGGGGQAFLASFPCSLSTAQQKTLILQSNQINF